MTSPIGIKHKGGPWAPGTSGNPGGRRKRLLKRLEESLVEIGKDPIGEIIKILDSDDVNQSVKLKAWLELLPYLYPKATETPYSDEDEVRRQLSAMTKEQLVERMEQDLARLKNSG